MISAGFCSASRRTRVLVDKGSPLLATSTNESPKVRMCAGLQFGFLESRGNRPGTPCEFPFDEALDLERRHSFS